MAPYVTAKVLPILKDTTTCWQPADYLPKPESDTFLDEVRASARLKFLLFGFTCTRGQLSGAAANIISELRYQ